VKVLFVCPFAPWPLVNGGKVRTYQLLRAAAERAELHVHLVREPEQAADVEDALRPFCASITVHARDPIGKLGRWTRPKLERWFHSSALRAALASATRDGGFDLVHLDELLLARTLSAHTPVPVVQHHHKLDTVLYGEIGTGGALEQAFDLWKLERLERESTRRTKHHVTCSQGDADVLIGRHGALDIGVVPSGFDPDVFAPDPAVAREPDHLLYLGSMDYGPNVDGVLWFHEAIWPLVRTARPDAVLDVVGGDPLPEVRALAGSDAGVVVHGRADSVPPWLRRTSALVVPLRIGGGTRLKIAEALGVGTPTVSTTVGAEGLDLVDGEHVALADTPEEFARRTLALLDDPGEACALGERGRTHALRAFTWRVLGDRLVDYWERVARGGRP